MPLKIFDLRGLADIDGGAVNERFKDEQIHLVKDMADAPHIDKPREITLRLRYLPKTERHGSEFVFVGADADVVIGSSTPKRTSNPISLKSNKQGQLFANELSQHDVDQMTVDDAVDRDTGEVSGG